MENLIKLKDIPVWYRALPHQDLALDNLEKSLTPEQHERLTQEFRTPLTPQEPPAQQPTLKEIVVLMTPTENYTPQGLRLFSLELTNNGTVVDRLECTSGQPGKQNLIPPKNDFSGSMRPIPEGIYEIGDPEQAGNGSWGEGLGEWWVTLKVVEQFRQNNRDGFGAHLDDNFLRSPGSAGCTVFEKPADLKRFLAWLWADARPTLLVVDYGFGDLRRLGYEGWLPGKRLGEPKQVPQVYAITPERRALLDTIAWAEGTNNERGYQTIFSYRFFNDFSDHPRLVQTSGGYSSDAAGRYQFLSTTWDEAARALNLPDFSPASQDQAALWLIDKKRNALADIDRGDLAAVLEKISWEWASLPPSRYGQPQKTVEDLQKIYQSFLDNR